MRDDADDRVRQPARLLVAGRGRDRRRLVAEGHGECALPLYSHLLQHDAALVQDSG